MTLSCQNTQNRGQAAMYFRQKLEVSYRLRYARSFQNCVSAPESPPHTGAANRTPSAPLSAAAPPSNSGRGFQRGGSRSAPLCQRGYGGRWRPPCFGWGSKGEGPLRQRLLPLALTWECPPAGASNHTGSPYSAQVLLSVTFTSIKLPIRLLSPFSRTSRLPSVREARGKFSSSLSPSTSTRTVLPT